MRVIVYDETKDAMQDARWCGSNIPYTIFLVHIYPIYFTIIP